MLTALIILGVLHLAGAVILWIGFRRAPEGREDATGFHLKKPDEPTERKPRKR